MARPPLRLCFDPEPGVLAAARECEADVFLDAYGNTVQELDAEYSAYDDHSHFLAVADTDDQVAVRRPEGIAAGPVNVALAGDLQQAGRRGMGRPREGAGHEGRRDDARCPHGPSAA